MDLNNVLAALSALSNPVEETRQAAQLQLYTWSQQPGLSAALATIMATAAAPLGARRWAAIFLKEQIRDHWLGDDDDDDAEAAGATELTYDENGQLVKTTTLNAAAMAAASLSSAHESYLERFNAIQAITIPEEDKVVVRGHLPALLADPHPQMRILAGNCIAAVASHDWPDAWPELLDGLIGMVAARASLASVQGALRCLLLFAEDLADERLLAALPSLLPALLGVFAAGDANPPSVRACALQLYTTCITALTYIEDVGSKVFERAMASYVTPTFQPMLTVISGFLSLPVPSSDSYSAALAPSDADSPAAAAAAAPLPAGAVPPASDSSGSLAAATAAETLFVVRAEAVRALGQLIAFFPKLMKPMMEQIAPAIFSGLVSAVPLFVEYAVFADASEVGDDAEADEDDAYHGLSAYILACLGVLSTLAEDSRSSGGKLLRLALPQLALPLGALLMLPASEVAVFEADPNVFIEREETASAGDAAPEGARSHSTGEDSAAGGAAAGGVSVVRDEVIALVGLMGERWPVTATESFAAAALRLAALGDELHTRAAAATTTAAAAAAGDVKDLGALVRGWWKPREAGTLLLGQIVDSFTRQSRITLQAALNDFVIRGYNQSLPASAQTAALAPAGSAASGAFLAARVAWVLAPLSGMLSRSVAAALSSSSSSSAAQGHETLAQVTALLTQCLAGPVHVAISATRTVRAAGVALGNVDDAVLAAGPEAVAALGNLQGPALAAWLPALCDQAARAGTGGAVLYSALAALAWACYAAGKWQEQVLTAAASAAGEGVAELAKISGVAAATKHVLLTHPAVAAAAATLPQGPIAAVQQAVGQIAGAVLAAWQACPMDHVVAEHVLEAVQGLAVLPGAGETVSEMILPSVIPLLGNDDVPATVKMVAMNLASILLRATAPPQPQGDVLNLAVHAPAAQLPAEAGAALRTVGDVAAAVRRPAPFGPAPSAVSRVYSPAVVLGGLLPAVLELGFTTDESHLVRGCAAITSTILAIYGPVIRAVLASPTGEVTAVAPGITADALRARVGRGAPQLLQRFIVLSQDPADVDIMTAADLNVAEDAPRVSEHTLAPAGRLATQLLACYCDVLGPAAAEALLGALVRKGLTAQTQTLKVALLLSFARAVVCDPHWVFTALQNMGSIEMTSLVREKSAKKTVGKKKGSKRGGASAGGVKLVTRHVPALAALVNVWLNVSEDLYSQYLCQVTSAAMATLLSLPDFAAALSQIPVDGPPAAAGGDSGPGPTTRSRGAPAPVKVPALHKMIAVLAGMAERVGAVQTRAVDRLLGRAPAKGEDEEDEEDLADLAMLHGSDYSDDGGDGDDGEEEEGEDGANTQRDSKAERKLKRTIERNLRGKLDDDDLFADAGDFDMSRFQDLLSFDETDDLGGGATGAAFDTTADEEDFPEYAYDVMFHTDAASVGLAALAGVDMDAVRGAAQSMGGRAAEAIAACMRQWGRA